MAAQENFAPEIAAVEKLRSLALLFVAAIASMSLWFLSSAVLQDMALELPITPVRKAALSSAVQAGFVLGAILSAWSGLPDRFDPRHVFAFAVVTAVIANLGLLVTPIGSLSAIGTRFLTGIFLAGVYPIGLKIAIGWGESDRGFLVGLLVGGLTLGSAVPHLLAWSGGTDWRTTLISASLLSLVSSVMILFCRLGPFHQQSAAFDPKAITLAWTDWRIRRAFLGYFGHMWELYTMWTWIVVALTVSFSATLEPPEASELAKLITFLAVGIGTVSCIYAGAIADRIGKAELTVWTMVISGCFAIATGLSLGGPIWLTIVLVLGWGLMVIPDSAQFSALVADFSPPEQAGSLLSLQTALGFALTTFTVQLMPAVAQQVGWPIALMILAAGPVFGVWAMWPLMGKNRVPAVQMETTIQPAGQPLVGPPNPSQQPTNPAGGQQPKSGELGKSEPTLSEVSSPAGEGSVPETSKA